MSKIREISEQEIFFLIKRNEEDRIYAQAIRKSRDHNYNPYPDGWNRHDFYKECFSDMFIDGFVAEYPHGRVIRQAQSSYYYRGENQIFNSSQASLYRRLNRFSQEDERQVEEFVAYLRVADFLDLLLRFNHTQELLSLRLKLNGLPDEFGIDLLYVQLAQHYGFETKWLDITSDFEVALFFACCKFDNTLLKWEPLNNKDFNTNDKSQYGVIFRKDSNHPTNFSLSDLQYAKIFPVGFQPFMRCHMQSSYMAKMDISFNLQEDNSFEILKFKHSEKLSNFIFEKMNCGQTIYPHEGLDILLEEIVELKQRKIFTQETFDFVLEEEIYASIDKEHLKKLLSKFGYDIVHASNFFPSEKITSLNLLYSGFDIEETYNIKLRTRLTR